MLGWELPPYNTGGLGVACYQLCKALATRGVELDFVVPYQNRHDNVDFMEVIPALPYSYEQLRLAGGAYDSHRFSNEPAHAHGLLGNLREQQAQYTEAVHHIVETTQYDAIHAHDWLTFEAALAAKQHTRKPLVLHVHATEFDRSGDLEHGGNPLIHEIEYEALSAGDKIIANSQATKDIIVKRYAIPASAVDVMYNSINPDELPPLEGENAYHYLSNMKKHGYKVVVSIGRLTIQKGLTHLLRAAKLVVDKDPSVIFLLAGCGEQYHELLELSARFGISEHVLFTGSFVHGKQWRDAYAIGDMFVLPSVSEPFGITPLEAIGYGTPVLISKQAGVGEVLHNALKFDFWDTRLLAEQILAMAEHDSLRSTLLANATEEFNTMSWYNVADTCIKIYNAALQPAGARA
jgi:glycosyltransferase involved in cell wall biosynthesis